MSRLWSRLEKLEANIGGTEPLIIDLGLPSGPIVLEGGQRELQNILNEIAQQKRSLPSERWCDGKLRPIPPA